jgi:molybdopterin-binding protein
MDLCGLSMKSRAESFGTGQGRRLRRERAGMDSAAMDSLAGQAYSLGMTLSARNRLEGKVTEIQVGGVMAHVVVSVGKNLIESVITKRSADEMKLKVGDTVSAVIKSTEVMLEKA